MRDEEGCPFGQQAETGRHRSFDVPTPPFTGTRPVTSSNKVRHAASAASLPAPAHARTRFRQFPPGHALLLPLAHTACEHRIGLSAHFPCTHTPAPSAARPFLSPISRLPGRSVAVFLYTSAKPPACPHGMCTQNRPPARFPCTHTPDYADNLLFHAVYHQIV